MTHVSPHYSLNFVVFTVHSEAQHSGCNFLFLFFSTLEEIRRNLSEFAGSLCGLVQLDTMGSFSTSKEGSTKLKKPWCKHIFILVDAKKPNKRHLQRCTDFFFFYF